MRNCLENKSDSELVKLFQQGNTQAFQVLIERHTESLSASLFFRVKDLALAEDLLQDTFLKIMEKVQSGHYNEKGMFKAWALQIAFHLSVDYFRTLKRKGKVVLVDSEVALNGGMDEYTPPDTLESCIEFNEKEIEFFISQLPEEQQEVVKLRHYHHFSFKEIADYTKESINTCLGRMRYALVNMRKILHEHQKVALN